jgi:hypothetical protein
MAPAFQPRRLRVNGGESSALCTLHPALTMQLRHTVLAVLVPVAVLGGYILSSMTGFISDAWDRFLGPFLITYWIGLGFTNMWQVTKASMKGFSPGMAVATVAVIIFVLLGMLGGIQALIDDPWLFGVVIAPGLDLVLPYLRRRRETADSPPGTTP